MKGRMMVDGLVENDPAIPVEYWPNPGLSTRHVLGEFDTLILKVDGEEFLISRERVGAEDLFRECAINIRTTKGRIAIVPNVTNSIYIKSDHAKRMRELARKDDSK